MPTSVISGTVVDPSGTPQAGTIVRARLVPKGSTKISNGDTITEVESTTTDGSGNWSLTLEETSNINPANSYYAVEEVMLDSSYNQYAIQVPADDSNVEDVIITPITPGNPLLVDTLTEEEHDALDHTGIPGVGSAHPDLTAHDTLGLATDAELAAAIAAHDADTSVHGVSNTTILLTEVTHDSHSHDGVPGVQTSIPVQDEPPASPTLHRIWIDSDDDGGLTDLTAHVIAADPHGGYQKESEKGAAGGYASLDGSALLLDAEIPSTITRDSELTSAIAAHDSDTSVHGVPDITALLDEPAHDLLDHTGLPGVGAGGGGATILQQDDPPSSPSVDDLWIDTNADYTGYDALQEYYGLDALNDEFGDGVLDAAWIRVDAPSAAHLVWTEAAGVLSAKHTGTDSAAQWHALMKPMGAFAIGKSIQAGIEIFAQAQNSPMAAVIISNGATAGAGTQVMGAYWNDTTAGNVGIRRTTTWTVDAATATLFTPGNVSRGIKFHIRLKWVAANSFQLSVSRDGVSWIDQAAQAYTLTPTHIGIGLTSWASAVDYIVTFDYFRVI